MIYRFIFISDEVDDFYREIQISSSASFLDLSNAILKSVGYPDDQMTSFFICEDNWEKREEITREEMNTSSEVDNFVMASTPLDELIEDEKQRLIYVFDPLTERRLSQARHSRKLSAPQARAILPDRPSTLMR